MRYFQIINKIMVLYSALLLIVPAIGRLLGLKPLDPNCECESLLLLRRYCG